MYMCIHLKISIVPIIRKRLSMTSHMNTVYTYFVLGVQCVYHILTHSVKKDSPLFM